METASHVPFIGAKDDHVNPNRLANDAIAALPRAFYKSSLVFLRQHFVPLRIITSESFQKTGD